MLAGCLLYLVPLCLYDPWPIVTQGVDLTGIVKRAGGVDTETYVHHHRLCTPEMCCGSSPGVRHASMLHTSCTAAAALHPAPA